MIKIFEFIPKAFAWIQIAIFPSLLGIGLGAAIYLYHPGELTLVVASTICFFGIAVGIIWATRIHRQRGAVAFMARVIATPELDKPSNNP
jgi:hypothetical protein